MVKEVRLASAFALAAVCLGAAATHAFFRPLIDPKLGDVVLFIFTVAGAIAGSIAGYGLHKYKTAEK